MSWVVLVVTASTLIATALYSVLQQERFIREFTADMRDLLDEAELVKKDLEAAMENAVILTRDLTRSLERRVRQVEEVVSNSSADVYASFLAERSSAERPSLPFSIEDLRRAHPYLVVPRLKEQGWSLQEIAQILGRGLGEIQLILDLHNRKEACS